MDRRILRWRVEGLGHDDGVRVKKGIREGTGAVFKDEGMAYHARMAWRGMGMHEPYSITPSTECCTVVDMHACMYALLGLAVPASLCDLCSSMLTR